MSYIVFKGSNVGGNKANLWIDDFGVMPDREISMNDTVIQDGNWHTIAAYSRGGGGVFVQFIFDKSNAADPSCTTSLSFG